MADVVVVGGGVGGMAAAIRLRAAGHRVTVVERAGVLGGKLATVERDGFWWDVGPSLLTLPHVFDDLFRQAGTTLEAELDLVRLDPAFRYRWADGSELVVPGTPEATPDAFDQFRSGAGDEWRRFDERGRRIWDVSERTFFAGPMTGPVSLARRLRSPFDLTAIDPMRTLAASADGRVAMFSSYGTDFTSSGKSGVFYALLPAV